MDQELSYSEALSFVNSERAYINPRVYTHEYPELNYNSFITVDTSAPSFASSVKSFTQRDVGQAMFVNGNADDIPLADVQEGSVETTMRTAGVGYGFGWEELNAAAQTGRRLDTRRGIAAREASERFIDELVFVGKPLVGAFGLFNHPDVATVALPNGESGNPSWETKTGDEMVADLDMLLTGTHTATGTTSMADTICLPYTVWFLMGRKRIGDGGATNETVLSFFRRNNAYTMLTGQDLNIRADRRLETAGVGGTRRIVAYTNSENVVSIQMPLPFRFTETFHDGVFHWLVPGVMRVGAVDFHQPNRGRYGDGA